MVDKQPKPTMFTPITIRGVRFRNRICVAPMSQHMCEPENLDTGAHGGMVNNWHLVHYGTLARGGAGLVMMEATGVEPGGRLSKHSPGLWRDDQLKPMCEIITFIKDQGAVPGLQLVHAGRKANIELRNTDTFMGWTDCGVYPVIAPSPIAYNDRSVVPIEATGADISRVTEAHVSAAKRAVEAEFQVIELHFGHGYLVSTFLSPITNKRTDEYGGSLVNRMRLALDIARGVRQALPDTIVLGVRLSVTDYCDMGWELENSIILARQLKQIGVDFIDCSSGDVVAQCTHNPLDPSPMQVDSAGIISRATGMATVAVGDIVEPLEAENILKQNGGPVMVFMGRA
ncbi:unnamed protein product, partial [Oppiella nova]